MKDRTITIAGVILDIATDLTKQIITFNISSRMLGFSIYRITPNLISDPDSLEYLDCRK